MTTLLWIRRIMVGWTLLAALYSSRNGPIEAFYAVLGWSTIFGILYLFLWVIWRFATLRKSESPRSSTLEDNQPDDGILPSMTRK